MLICVCVLSVPHWHSPLLILKNNPIDGNLTKIVLQRRHASLFFGTVMCIAGLTTFVYLAPADFLTPGFVRDSMLIQSQHILPNEHLNGVIPVTDLDHDISIIMNKPTSEIPLKTEIKDPNGITISDVDISESLRATFRPEILGEYTVTVTNLDSKSTMISAYYGHHLPEITDTQDTQIVLGYLWVPLIIGGSYLIVHTNFKVALKAGKNLN